MTGKAPAGLFGRRAGRGRTTFTYIEGELAMGAATTGTRNFLIGAPQEVNCLVVLVFELLLSFPASKDF